MRAPATLSGRALRFGLHWEGPYKDLSRGLGRVRPQTRRPSLPHHFSGKILAGEREEYLKFPPTRSWMRPHHRGVSVGHGGSAGAQGLIRTFAARPPGRQGATSPQGYRASIGSPPRNACSSGGCAPFCASEIEAAALRGGIPPPNRF